MNAPTLIIGLGGKGSDIVLRVSKMATKEEKKSIGFAVFDTDVNELKEIKQNNPEVRTIQTSTKLSVGEYLDIDTHSRDTWFPVNAILNSKQLTEGAGQVRAISRLAFETAVRAGKMEELHKAIEDLYKLEGNEYEQALRVIIVSSLAGGTGSGLILPVALYVKNYLATHFRQGANITRGFFILPEVFYEVISGQAERNNLKCNAYATLRELDAFLMKGDATLPERYKDSVKVEFPNVSSDTYEEYNVRPFDFCFLFDAQNADGKKLNSFNQYLDHAASCIYAQSIGPMNKRSNSSEDNTIRKLAKEAGRNRYAGAGTSILIYPKDDVCEYLALNWARECISDQWLLFDKEFKKRKADIAKMRREGVRVHDIEMGKTYVNTIFQRANNNDPFAVAIADSCSIFDEDGFDRLGDTWESYVGNLQGKIKEENSFGQPSLDEAKRAATNRIAELSDTEVIKKGKDGWVDYQDAYNLLIRYKNLVSKNSNDTAYTVAYTIFKSENESIVTDGLQHQLETYLRDNRTKQFVHPNAVRYFLYNLLKVFQDQAALVEMKCKKELQFFDSFEVTYFDDKDTEDVIEGVNDLARTKKIRLADKIRRRVSDDQEALIAAYSTYLGHINDYRVDSILKVVIDEGINYVQNLCHAFENFFMSLEDRIASIDKKIQDIEKKYDYVKGTAKRFVCASPKCLKAMAEDMPYTGSFLTIDGRLAEEIYTRVRNYAMMSSKPDDTDFFGEIFEEGILGYFRKSLMEIYGGSIDIDVVDAIEKEAEYVEDITQEAEKRNYVKRVFDESKILAAPFIEKPIGEEKDPINSCAYNNKLNPKDDSPRAQIIDKELRNFGGEEDADIPKNKILFYKSFYGLRATDLSKFAPPQKTETFERTGGEYFRAYYELVEKIHPRADLSKVITPHIDKWWHNVSKMPDLDDENQRKQENNIYRALFWGLLGNYVELSDNGENNKIYRLNVDDLGLEGELNMLIVSNGTPCDRLYEILDALSIYPELVNRINGLIQSLLDKAIEDNIGLNNCKITKWLDSFRLREYPLEGNETRSLFDLPLLIKRNIPAELYQEEDIIKILKVELSEIVRYTMELCDEKEAIHISGRIIVNQFETLLHDLELEKQEYRNFYHDILFDRFTTIIRKFLENMNLKKEAEYVAEKVAALKLQ